MRLAEVWRGRRVVMAGKDSWIKIMLEELGVQVKLLTPDADVQTMCRIMQEERVHALILPCTKENGSAGKRLSMLERHLAEAREAGVPLTMMYSDEPVYRFRKGAALGKEGKGTREELIQAILQLYADGVTRGAEGDPVQVMIVRRMPCMKEKTVDAWCEAVLEGRAIHVLHPQEWNVFQHPLDAAAAVIALGARYLSGEMEKVGIFDIGTNNVCTNRDAALVFAQRYGRRCFFCEDGERGKIPEIMDEAPALCLPALSTQEALDFRKAALAGETQQDQVRRYLENRA